MKRFRVNWVRLLIMTAMTTALVTGTVIGLTRAAAPPPPMRTVRVAPGDTLWGIAKQHGPARTDLRRLTFDLERLNGLQGQVLRPGMTLKLPAGWN
jgi:LysM repeat protein